MSREAHRISGRRRMAIALGVSVAVHAIAIGTLTLDIPLFDQGGARRSLEVVDLADQWTTRAMDIVRLETDPNGVSNDEAATSARVEATQPGAAGVATEVTAVVPLASLPSAAPDAPAVDVTVEPSVSLTPSPQIAARPSNRGTIQRSASRGIVEQHIAGRAVDAPGYDFVALSDAARAAERARGGNGRGGIGGTGIKILGGMGDDHCQPGMIPGMMPGVMPIGASIPGLGGLPMVISILGSMGGGMVDEMGEQKCPGMLPGSGHFGGFGGVPMQGKGKGIIGWRPSLPGGGAAINKVGPPLGGGG